MVESKYSDKVQELLQENEPISQESFVKHVDESTDLSRGDTLLALKSLMQDRLASYTLDYKLQTEL
jgi:hypothetical protein